MKHKNTIHYLQDAAAEQLGCEDCTLNESEGVYNYKCTYKGRIKIDKYGRCMMHRTNGYTDTVIKILS